MTGEDGPHDSVGQGAAPPRLTVKITWALAGRVTEPGRYIFTFGWQTRTAKALIAWNSQIGLQERPDDTRRAPAKPPAHLSAWPNRT